MVVVVVVVVRVVVVVVIMVSLQVRVEGVSAKDQLLAWVNEDTALQVRHVSRVTSCDKPRVCHNS